MKTRLAAAVVICASVATPATAAIYGSAGWATLRNCNLVTASQSCDGSGPGQQIAQQQLEKSFGPLNQNADFFQNNPFPQRPTLLADNWYRAGFSAPDSWSFPFIKARTNALGNVRTNVNVFAFQTYTNFDPVWSHHLDNDATLDIWDSSASPADPGLPNGATYTFYVAWWEPWILMNLTMTQPTEEWFRQLFYIPCGTPGVMAAGGGQGVLTTGAPTRQRVNVKACDSPDGATSLGPGLSAALVVGLQLPVNRGGWIDATHSLTVDWGENVSSEQLARMRETLVPAYVSRVPEPASWALILCGLGLVSRTALRRFATA